MTSWQPIETAPKDGTFILGWHPALSWPHGRQDVVAWDETHLHWTDGCFEVSWPTHWMPLPEPPQ